MSAALPISPRSTKNHTYSEFSGFANNLGYPRAQMIIILAAMNRLVVTESPLWDPFAVKDAQALNPNLKALRYYSLAGSVTRDTASNLRCPILPTEIETKGWWLTSGGIVVKDGASVWIADVGKPRFKEAYALALVSRLKTDLGYRIAGVVLDYWASYDWLIIRAANNILDGYPDKAAYNAAWHTFISYVYTLLKAHSCGLIIGNQAGMYGDTSPWCTDNRNYVDGTVYESFCFDWAGKYLTGSMAERRIDALYRDPLETWVSDVGFTFTDPADLVVVEKLRLAQGMYFLALNTATTPKYHNVKGTGAIQFFEDWNTDIGQPFAGPPTKRSDYYAWSRTYTRGIVLVCYDSRSVTMTLPLGADYLDQDGKARTGSVVLAPHTAMILRRK